MANRRMFSKRVIHTARFLKMPISTQCLYFHLGLNADDDGIVEAFTVLNLIGATEDDLKVLVAKGFVQILNEDLVTYITDWKENNQIRADRKVDSIYKDLLVQINPEIELLEKKPRADRIKTLNGTSQGQPMDTIGKDRLGKNSIEENSINIVGEFEKVWSLYPKKQGKRDALKAFKKAIKAGVAVEVIEQAIIKYTEYVNSIEWLNFKNGSTWFNQECWNDDYTINKATTNRSSSRDRQSEIDQLGL